MVLTLRSAPPFLSDLYYHWFLYLHKPRLRLRIVNRFLHDHVCQSLLRYPAGITVRATQSRKLSLPRISGIRSWIELTGSTDSLVMTANIGIWTPLCFSKRYSPARYVISAPSGCIAYFSFLMCQLRHSH